MYNSYNCCIVTVISEAQTSQDRRLFFWAQPRKKPKVNKTNRVQVKGEIALPSSESTKNFESTRQAACKATRVTSDVLSQG